MGASVVHLGLAVGLYCACVAGVGAWDSAAVYADATGALAVTGFALAALPWVWAVTTWMPGGRMPFAVLAIVGLLGWLVEGAVLPALAPGLPESLDWGPWIAITLGMGIVVAIGSWPRAETVGRPAQRAAEQRSP